MNKYFFWTQDQFGNAPIGPIPVFAENEELATIKANRMIAIINEDAPSRHFLTRIEKTTR